MDIRWPAGEGSWEGPGLKGRAVERNQACKRGQLKAINPTSRAVRSDQANRGRKLVTNRLAGEQLDINQTGMGVVRVLSGWQAEAVRGNQEGKQVSIWEPAVLVCERDVQLPI